MGKTRIFVYGTLGLS